MQRTAYAVTLCAIVLILSVRCAGALTPEGYVVWQRDTQNTLFGDNWTTDFTASEETLQDVGGEPRHISMAWSWDRNESLVIVHDVGNDINLVVLNMTDRSTLYTTEFTAGGPNINYRSADVAYMGQSGEGLIVWDAAGSDTTIDYSIWNGSALSVNGTINLPSLSTTRRFLKLTPNPATDDVMLVYNDGLNDISAILWNGTGWEAGVYATNTGIANGFRRPMDFAWYPNGSGIFFYADQPGTNGLYYRNFTYETKTWSAGALAIDLVTSARQIEACANPVRPFVGVIMQDTGNDVNVLMWNGTDFEGGNPSEDAATENAGDNAECEWERNGEQALFLFIDNAQLSIDYFHYNLSITADTGTWSTGSLLATDNTGNIAADDIESVTTSASPLSDEIMIITKDLLFDVRGFLWDGDTIAAPTTNFILEDVSNGGSANPTANSQSFAFAWNKLGLRPPAFNGAVTDGSDDTTPTEEGLNVTFTANATNGYGGNYYLLVCASHGTDTGDCTGTEICRSPATASDSIASCQHNTSGESSEQYAWYAYACNDDGACSAPDFTNSPYDVNHAPITDPYLSTFTPTVSDTITCFANATDTDIGDSVINVFAWYHQNEGLGGWNLLAGETGNQLSAPSFDSNDKVRCEVTPTDSHGFAGTTVNTSEALVQNGTLTAASALGASQILRTASTTLAVNCTMSGGDSEDVVLVVEDNSSGAYAQSSETPGALFVNESQYGYGGLASATSPTRSVLVTANSAGNYSIRVQCQAADAIGSPANSTPENLEVVLDTTPPVISGVDAIDLSSTTATIVWDTDDAADSTVDYGTSPTLGNSIVDPSLLTSHSSLVIGLNKTTLYYYNVTSCNVDGYCSTSGPGTFTTTTSDDEATPITTGYCTGVYRENGTAHEDGYLTDGDVFSFYCETPHRIYEDERFSFTLTNAGKQLRRTLAVPSVVYGDQVVLYP